ncbi:MULTISPECIES: hypothetical protein [unclassified Romboutsia]|uniref:hypothetical protein n=1 Tax=unclassified Romboutsia TaxID=2626894 RepID=UPI000821D63F|nr:MULTISPECIES: hypothetical protein [unclassified Romboutsia]SCI36429.1 Uncharacterised protein [uncultured Clostridium sp.]
MAKFNHIKDLYEDGYRCIYYDCAQNNHTVYLKNFDTESSEVIELDDDQDFSEFKSYIGGLRMS